MSTKEERIKSLHERELELKRKIKVLAQRRRTIETSEQRARRRKENQAKIVFGALAKDYLDHNPKDQWFKQFMRESLKASPTLKINPLLVEWAKALGEGKQGG
jgi:hypothetical protein